MPVFRTARLIPYIVPPLAFIALMISITFGPSPIRVSAQGAVSTAALDAISSEMITVSGTAIGISAGVLTVATVPADECFVTTEAQPLRWNISGTTPTASIGHLAPAGTTILVQGRPNLAAFRMIRTGTDASVAVTCSRKVSP